VALKIDVISDVVCPWCYIGKRKLARALELFREGNPDGAAPQVTWHPFQLNPDIPEQGVDRGVYLERKFGGRSTEIYARVSAAGAQVGIPFAFDRVTRQPNTVAAHSLITLAADAGLQDAAVEAFFNAYFIEGRDLTSSQTLTEIACAAGLAEDQVQACLASTQAREHVQAEDAQARRLGVGGVPFFILNRRYAVSSAQDPEVLLEAMLKSESDASPQGDG
jgi:predicted DsbA family dithiol-disulfide isomerase